MASFGIYLINLDDSPDRLAALSEFHHIITDQPPAPEARAALDEAGLSLTIADPQEAEA